MKGKLLKAASLHFAHKLSEGKRETKQKSKLNKQQRDKTSQSKNQEPRLRVPAPPQVSLLRRRGLDTDAHLPPSRVSYGEKNNVKYRKVIENVEGAST